MKRLVLLFVLAIMGRSVFAMSLKKVLVYVWNYSSKTITIAKEYHNDPSKKFYHPSTRAWNQNVCGVFLTIHDLDLNAEDPMLSNQFRMRPGQVLTILDYYPSGNIIGSVAAWAQLDQIPFMDLMRSIFKKIEIFIEEEGRVITLENLGEQIIKKLVGPGGMEYIIEIFDYDLIGKPGSEW